MKTHIHLLCITVLGVLLGACGGGSGTDATVHEAHGMDAEHDADEGPHHGRLLTDGEFALELSVFETGVPPEFRVWVTEQGRPVKPDDVELTVTLNRLGGRVDTIGFKPQDDFLRGDTVVREPHSFVVSIEADYRGKRHSWQYDSFEGRTRISREVAEAFELETLVAGPAVLRETLTVYGRITSNSERVREVSARFDGLIQAVYPSLGETVREGQPLAKIESNESLKAYTIKAPISGVITATNPKLLDHGRVNSREAYSDGWIMRIHADNLRRELKHLMINAETAVFVEEETQHLYRAIEETAGPLAADGGQLVEDIYGQLPQIGWKKIVRLFLRS